MDAIDNDIPRARPRDGQAVPDVASKTCSHITAAAPLPRAVIERGVVKINDTVEIVGLRDTRKTVATGIEMFRKLLDSGQAGDNVGILLRGIEKEDIERGRCSPPEIDHAAQEGQGRNLRAVQGRRWPPHAVLQRLSSAVLLPHDGRDRSRQSAEGRRDDHAGRQHLGGDRTDRPIAMEKTQKFAIREGGRTIGAGRVTEIIE